MSIHSLLTGSENVTLLKTIPTERIVEAWLSEFAIDIEKEMHGVSSVLKYRCNDTGLIFFSPSDVTGSEWLYQQLQHIPWYYQKDKWEYRVARCELQQCKSVLEIGCGTGEFLKILRNDAHDVAGLELNLCAVSKARQAGLNVSAEPLGQYCISHRERFDAVCSFQVLEHVPDPMNFIQNTLEMVKPGGKIAFAVPNSAGFEGLGYDLLQDPPHHMTWWTADCFRSLPSVVPLILDKVVVEPLTREHIPNYLQWNMLRMRERSRHYRWIFNRSTLPVYKRFLSTSLRFLFSGHALYTQFLKV